MKKTALIISLPIIMLLTLTGCADKISQPPTSISTPVKATLSPQELETKKAAEAKIAAARKADEVKAAAQAAAEKKIADARTALIKETTQMKTELDAERTKLDAEYTTLAKVTDQLRDEAIKGEADSKAIYAQAQTIYNSKLESADKAYNEKIAMYDSGLKARLISLATYAVQVRTAQIDYDAEIAANKVDYETVTAAIDAKTAAHNTKVAEHTVQQESHQAKIEAYNAKMKTYNDKMKTLG
jgi:chromosome segregation ATPase